ncbi:MAG: recombinase family protein [Gammaproteobacteria bacterium]|nr:recombinase family protein [Gammaproteobacteria bacterium]
MEKHTETSLPRGKTIGYLRVSTDDQDLEKNKADILKLANEKDLGRVQFIEEAVSGRVLWKKRKVAEILEHCKTGDNIIVSELSRLGRSMLECMEILSIALEQGIHVYAVKGNWQLDQSIQSKIIAMAFSMAAEIERDLISQRTKEALRAKKAAGMKLGRPKGPGKSKLDAFRSEIEALLANGSTQKFIAQRYSTTEANLHNWMKKRGIKKPKSATALMSLAVPVLE